MLMPYLAALTGGGRVPPQPELCQHNHNKVVFFAGKSLSIHSGTSLWIFSNSTNPQQIQHKNCADMDWDTVLKDSKSATFVCVAKDLANANRKFANFKKL